MVQWIKKENSKGVFGGQSCQVPLISLIDSDIMLMRHDPGIWIGIIIKSNLEDLATVIHALVV